MQVRLALQLQRLPNLAGLEDLRSQAIATLTAINQCATPSIASYPKKKKEITLTPLQPLMPTRQA